MQVSVCYVLLRFSIEATRVEQQEKSIKRKVNKSCVFCICRISGAVLSVMTDFRVNNQTYFPGGNLFVICVFTLLLHINIKCLNFCKNIQLSKKKRE